MAPVWPRGKVTAIRRDQAPVVAFTPQFVSSQKEIE